MAKMTLTEYNARNRQFWDDQQTLLARRMANVAIREPALAVLQAEIVKRLPIRFQTSIYQALEAAEQIGTRFLTEQSRKGGGAKKTDTLQLLIEKIVQRRPAITLRQLEAELEAHQGIDTIEDIADGTISFTNHNGSSKDAPLTGLKDRLSRAKKKMRSR
jgi:hypothetical protein